MSLYKFKEIHTVPNGKDMCDIVLSRTQRKTPTVVHPQFRISRIRSFYMRKVKFCQTTINEKLSKILEDFPKIDDIHPFYADLCNVLYDRDHYKLALGQVNAVRGIVDNIGKDYVKLMKFADTPYKCKMLKRAGLGRMCTAVKKLQNSLVYLEEVRQHLGRLPSINPNTRTLLITGYPNVGKSSFMNCVSQANVDVQPYAFTTKSLFVGHFDYDYCRWQVIDTPGILDHPLEDRNTIEMTAITALAHIQATVMFFIDISEDCGWTIKQQVALFHSIKPLFKGKELLVVLNKTDLVKFEALSAEDKAELEALREVADVKGMMPTSCATKEGVDGVKNLACQLLLSKRVEQKIRSNKTDAIANRIYMTSVTAPADRAPQIPAAVLAKRAKKAAQEDLYAEEEEAMELEKDIQEANGGAGVHSVDLRKTFLLKKDEWKYDVLPEILDGHNVADFVDPDIDARLAELEAEEELLFAASVPTAEELQEEETLRASLKVAKKVESKRKFKALESVLKKSAANLKPTRLGRKDCTDLVEELADRGTPLAVIEEVVKRRSKSSARGRSLTSKRKREDDEATARGESIVRSRSRSKTAVPSRIEQSLPPEMREKADSLRKKKMRKLSKEARRGEGDRHIPDFKPKHLFSGKRGRGKTDWR